MRKILVITEEVEKHLLTIMDQALKSAGWQAHMSVDVVLKAVRSEEENSAEVK